MIDEKSHPRALEQAARAVHEAYHGAGTWSAASTPERSHARQCVRLMCSALSKNGLELTGEAGASGASDAAKPAAPAPAGARPQPRPAPRRF